MNMFERFDENPAMTLQDIKKTKRYGRTDRRTDNVKTVYPPQTRFAGGITNKVCGGYNNFTTKAIKKINKCFSGHIFEKQMRQAGFFSQEKNDEPTCFNLSKTNEAPFFHF